MTFLAPLALKVLRHWPSDDTDVPASERRTVDFGGTGGRADAYDRPAIANRGDGGVESRASHELVHHVYVVRCNLSDLGHKVRIVRSKCMVDIDT